MNTPSFDPSSNASSSHELTQVQQGLIQVMVDQVLEGADDINLDTDLFDAGLDSMAIMQLLLLIDERFGVMLTSTDLTRANFATIRVLASLVHTRMHAGSDADASGG